MQQTITFAQLVKNNGYSLYDLFGQTKPSSVGGYYDYADERTWVKEEDAYFMPYSSSSPYADLVEQSNYKAITNEFADLFEEEILTEKNGNIYIYHVRPYHNEDRLNELIDVLHELQNYPVIDENLWSLMENEAQTEFIRSEIKWFAQKLDVHPDMEFLFDTNLITDETLEKHIWQLINEHNLEFEMSYDAYIDIEKIARLSPLYRLGYSAYDTIMSVIDKLETAHYSGIDTYTDRQIYHDLQQALD